MYGKKDGWSYGCRVCMISLPSELSGAAVSETVTCKLTRIDVVYPIQKLLPQKPLASAVLREVQDLGEVEDVVCGIEFSSLVGLRSALNDFPTHETL